MTSPPPVTLADLTPYTSRDGHTIPAGCYGVSHGSGILGELIRHATESWAGHAFLHVGNGRIVEGTAPVAVITSADDHPDAVWNIHEQLTDQQRLAIVARAHALIGTPYDYAAYIGFALETMNIRSGAALDPLFKQDTWRVCSALVADSYSFGGITVDAALHDVNLVSPADLYNRIARLP